MKKANSQGNTLVIVLVVIGVLVIGYIVAAKFVLPSAINKVVNTAIDTSVNNLNFDNAQSFQVNQNLSKNEGMFLQMGINKGKISIDGKNQGDMLTGEIKYLGTKPTYDYQTDKDKVAVFIIKSADQAGDNPILHLSQKTNGRIDISLGAGAVDIDLTDLDIPVLNIGSGAGIVNITFSKNASTMASIGSGAGKLNVSVYKGSGIKLKFAQGVSNLDLGNAYEKVGDAYQTKGYDGAKVKVELNVGQAVGGFNIQEIK